MFKTFQLHFRSREKAPVPSTTAPNTQQLFSPIGDFIVGAGAKGDRDGAKGDTPPSQADLEEAGA